VPLNVYAFRSYPRQTVTTYDSAGNINDGPRLFYNLRALRDRVTQQKSWLQYAMKMIRNHPQNPHE
jgi:hypothetical protein